MTRILIVDDEPLARDTARLVLSVDPSVEIVGACSGIYAAAQIAQAKPDIVFLDVQMPVVDGFDVIAQVGLDAMPAVVFVTAYDQYAVRAFDVHAIDYVLKPYDDARLLAALARAKQRIAERTSSTATLSEVLADHPRTLHRFAVRERERIVFVDTADVDALEAADDYVELHVGDTVHLLRERLGDLESRLDPAQFARIHRSTIVNLARVRELHPLVRGDALVVLEGGATFRLSRSRRDEFERRLSDSPRSSDSSPHRR
jgi:two-component system LytT family response regulator